MASQDLSDEGYDIIDGAMEVWYDEEEKTVYVGPHEKEAGQFEEFIRTQYPDAEIVFTTPGLKRDVRAEKRAQQKANIERQIAGIGDQLRDLKARSATGQAMVLIRQREALQQQLGELE